MFLDISNKLGKDGGDRQEQAREINFGDDCLIADHGIGSIGQRR